MPETRAPSPPPSTTANWDVATSNAAAHGAVPSGRSSEDDSGGSDEGSRLVPSASESCESEEYDDSGDESFTPDSEACERDVESLSTTSASSHGDLFKGYVAELTELYKRLDGIQQYQLFSTDISKPGVVSCRKSPESDAIQFDLRRKIDGALTSQEKVLRILTEHLETLPPPPPPPNTEKIAQMFQSIRPYVPDEFCDDPMYAKPSERQQENAKTAKQVRRTQRAAMAVAAKRNQDQRGKRERRRLREDTRSKNTTLSG
ncbi:hypothetical protein L915_14099 [Phytophthora nicotianae]|uniref:Uncharacterized protein n=1 Tax=Phytophthora nicotianae TaxID=4792 RepID=W2GAP9_PHYNI|nr:hypothetical protein L915_14099 [Phytophthora nicotianae]